MWNQIKRMGLRLFLPKLLEKIFLGLEEKDIMTSILNTAAEKTPSLRSQKTWQAFIRCVSSLLEDWKNEAKALYNKFD